MIDSKKLLSDLQKFVHRLENDLRARCKANAEVDRPLRAAYEEARKKGRTASTYASWRGEELNQIAVAWVLAAVFIRFLEDNELIEPPYLAGTGSRLQRAKDEHEMFFRQHPTLTEREYLEKVFTEVGGLPAMKEFFDRKKNPLWRVAPSGDASKDLLDFWRKTDPETGKLIHDFYDPDWDTRFLGDLYQDLSEAARKRYALLQTPVFIEQFILDRTLTPAIETFGFHVVRMIDPTCGSGHFLLGGFQRLFRLWLEHQPGGNPRVLAQKALDGVYGVDLNPYAVAIARFRLLLAALEVCDVKRLRDAPDFSIHLAVGDSLLHGRRFREFENNTGPQRTFDTEELFRDELKHHYEVEDTEALHRVLGQQYHAVVGNPPYITVKDRALSELYRARYLSCHRKYSLSVPFMERFFDLAVKGDGTPQQPAGFVGQITANSFMKREFGKKLIEEYLPRWDLTEIIDTSGAYIPGHTTSTVILFWKNQPPVSDTIRTVLGIRGEPATPDDPAQGLVWQAIVRQIDQPGSGSEWVSAADSPRENFHRHPWSIGGGGAAELKEMIDAAGEVTLGSIVDQLRGRPNIGITAFTLEDDAYMQPADVLVRQHLSPQHRSIMVEGDKIRDWALGETSGLVWPYSHDFQPIKPNLSHPVQRYLWSARTSLANNLMFGQETKVRAGLNWYEFGRLNAPKLRKPNSIIFAFVATHNHFMLDSGGKVFNRSAPVIKLRSDATHEDHIYLVGLLNSSTACFWLKQVMTSKGLGGQGGGIKPEHWHRAYEFDSTKLASFPIPKYIPQQLADIMVTTRRAMQAHSPVCALTTRRGPVRDALPECLASARSGWVELRGKLIAWQEELDWQIYEAFGLVEPPSEGGRDAVSLPQGEAMDSIPPEGLELGERAFEIVLARRMDAGEVQTTWFELHGSTPITELPRHWPAAYRELVQRRIRRIESDSNIRLIEQPEYKRRWNTEPWNEQFAKAARDWLLARVEGYFHDGQRVCDLKDGFNPAATGFAPAIRPALTTTNQLAGTAQIDRAFLAVAEQLMGGPGFSVAKLVRGLVESASVPFLPVQRYKPSGLRKRHDWEHVWELQRREDAVEVDVRSQRSEISEEELKKLIRQAQQEKVGDIPVPPKYASSDFNKTVWWSLRGKLDVPKERWISYPGAEPDGDRSPLIAWAGWNHLQQAQAIAEYYLDAKSNQGWPATKLMLLLAGLLDLLPWLKQWHNEADPDYGMGLGDYFEGFLDEECRSLGLTKDEVNEGRFSETPRALPTQA